MKEESFLIRTLIIYHPFLVHLNLVANGLLDTPLSHPKISATTYSDKMDCVWAIYFNLKEGFHAIYDITCGSSPLDEYNHLTSDIVK